MAAARAHHAIIRVNERGSTVTLCDGRWGAYDPQCYHPGLEAFTRLTNVCGACESLSRTQRLLLAALQMLLIRDDKLAPIAVGGS